MVKKIRNKIYHLLRWSEKWTKTDMVYLAKGGFWLTGSKIIGSLTAFALAIAYANLMPKDTYATYKYVLSIAAILSITTLPGMNTALTRAIALGYEGSIKKAIKTKFKWSLLGHLVGICISLYYFTQGNKILGFSILIASTFTIIINSIIIYGIYLQGKKNFKTSSIYSSINQITIGLVIIITIFFHKNIILLIFNYFLTSLTTGLILLYLTFKNSTLNKKEDADTISFGKHLSIMNLIGTLANNIDKILMWHFLGPFELAIYSFAILPVMQVENFVKQTTTMAFPKLTTQKTKILQKSLPKKVLKFILLLIPFSIFYMIISPHIYKVFFPEYLSSIKYSQFFALTIILFPQRFFATSLSAHAQKKALYSLKIIDPLFKIILMCALIPTLGVLGAIMALMFSLLFSGLISYYFFKNIKNGKK